MAQKTNSKKLDGAGRTIFSVTEQAHGDHVAGYATINRHADGAVWLTVRSSGGEATAGVQISEEQLAQMASAINDELA